MTRRKRIAHPNTQPTAQTPSAPPGKADAAQSVPDTRQSVTAHTESASRVSPSANMPRNTAVSNKSRNMAHGDADKGVKPHTEAQRSTAKSHNKVKKQSLHAVLERVPVEIWLRIISEVAFEDIDYQRLAKSRTHKLRFFPNIMTLSLVNRAFRHVANQLKDHIVTVTNEADATAFMEKSRSGLPTRLLNLGFRHGSEYDMHVLSAARGVTHLVVGRRTLLPADLLNPELKDLKTLHLEQTDVHRRDEHSVSPLSLPFALDKFNANVHWHADSADAAFFAAILQNTAVSLKLVLGCDAAANSTSMDISLPTLLPHFGTVQPIALRHLTLLVSDYDGFVLDELEPVLGQCHSLKTLHTSLVGPCLGMLLQMLPVTTRLHMLRLTVAGCHFQDAYTWRDEEEDLGGLACDTECDALKTMAVLSRLRHLIIEKRGTRRGRSALFALCRARRIKLTWTTTERLKTPKPVSRHYLIGEDYESD